jgi:hypothetical protein
LRISEAVALTEKDLEPKMGSVLMRAGKGGSRRMVAMDGWKGGNGRWSQFSVLNRIRGVMRCERTDAELLSSALASDFGCFYDRHVRAVTAFVGSWIGEPDVAFDLVAETLRERSIIATDTTRPRGPRCLAVGDRAQLDDRTCCRRSTAAIPPSRRQDGVTAIVSR